MNRAETGRRGEAAAARWYQKQGCRLLAHNFHTRMGELDVVVQSQMGPLSSVRSRPVRKALWPARQKRWTGPNSAA